MMSDGRDVLCRPRRHTHRFVLLIELDKFHVVRREDQMAAILLLLLLWEVLRAELDELGRRPLEAVGLRDRVGRVHACWCVRTENGRVG